eukprot:NODE_4034_length_704_cov_137.464122_g3410_i0.p2 GENE.NODE_4034_length_704_cov_137.464122_g3410_i0~~NODE_4034_length_704_cov_137.464122_g3410_i0.p2  ORF type:complete len:97 (+),score=21.85 NODE_4034_length_704_cov_137.464122_g3410_i0:403-693(+)
MLACFVVLMTRMELEQQSETTEDENPMNAFRSSFLPSVFCCGSFSCSVLCVKNHGKCPTKVADAAARDPWKNTVGPLALNFALSAGMPLVPPCTLR